MQFSWKDQQHCRWTVWALGKAHSSACGYFSSLLLPIHWCCCELWLNVADSHVRSLYRGADKIWSILLELISIGKLEALSSLSIKIWHSAQSQFTEKNLHFQWQWTACIYQWLPSANNFFGSFTSSLDLKNHCVLMNITQHTNISKWTNHLWWQILKK